MAKIVIRKHMEEQSQSQFKNYLENSLDAIMFVHEDKVIFQNTNATELLAFTEIRDFNLNKKIFEIQNNHLLDSVGHLSINDLFKCQDREISAKVRKMAGGVDATDVQNSDQLVKEV